ncbi:hypothetical protein HBO27_10995 [Pseudomonas koreensis]|nr:hypothetical protein [Pseudomonas koreensis]NNA56355.1 hypothetical protein [Pseudomonas koreensis]
MASKPLRVDRGRRQGVIEHKIALLGFGLPFNEVIGRKREDLVASLPQRLAPSMKGKCISVRVRP